MVLQDYFDNHIPRAITIAAGMARSSKDTFSYMTHAWVLAFFMDCEGSGFAEFRPPHEGMPLLRCPNSSAISALKAAIERRHIHFHAFPHSANPGLFDVRRVGSNPRGRSPAILSCPLQFAVHLLRVFAPAVYATLSSSQRANQVHIVFTEWSGPHP